jgi:flagellar hook-associated protein 3 FlgL
VTISSISTASLTSILSQSVNSMQTQLANAELELSTGQDANVGLSLGAEAGQDISLQQQQSFMQTLTSTNNLVATRLSTTQNALSSIQTTAQDFLNSLISNEGSQTSASILQTTATSSLQSMISTLNTTENGDYIFAGTNTSNAPIFGSAASNATAVNSAFSAALSAAGSTASTMSGTDMTNFLTGSSFTGLFTGSDWTSNWSSASDQPLTTQISTSDTETTSVSANQTAFQQLTEAYTMVSSLATQNLSSDAYQAVTTQAQSLVSSAISGLTDIQANVGVVQSDITDSNNQMSAQMTILSTQVTNLESADAYDAATNVNNLQTQIETAYSLTNQLHQLSLVNYIS